MFRFEYEDRENTLYCYELEISKAAQRTGLGTILMGHLMTIGSAWEMDKIMLTVFKENSPALKFYQTVGFIIDPSSPSYLEDGTIADDVEDVDYEIMSKVCG